MSKVIECLEQNIRKQNKQIDNKLITKMTIKYKANEQITQTFELKYGNTKLLGNTKHNQVKLVPAVFLSAYLYQYSIKLY